MARNRIRPFAACALVACAVAVVPLASAGSSSPRLASGPDPLPTASAPNHCGSAAGVGANDRHGWEAEPTLAVNPTNPANLVTAWIQDWSDAIALGYSNDGGATWREVVPPTSICTPGGPAAYNSGAADPSLSFSKPGGPRGGTLYLSALVGGDSGSAAVVDRSFDGGKTWSGPAVLDSAASPFYIDGSQIVADLRKPGYAYAVWRKGDITFTTRAQYISHTTDGGATWSPPTQIRSAALQLGGALVALRDGTLVDVFSEFPYQPGAGVAACPHGPTTIMAARSTDLGVTWSLPSPVALGDATLITGVAAASAPDGSVHIGWQQTYTTAAGPRVRYLHSKSTDDGLTWQVRPDVIADVSGSPEYGSTSRIPPNPALPLARCLDIAAEPALAVGGDGTVGVAFYDHRRDPGNNPSQVTDFWFSSLRDGGRAWHEQHVAGPFDQTAAPSTDDSGLPGGPGFLGDYPGLAATDFGFATSFALSQPLPGANFGLANPPTDIFFARLPAGRPR